ncbi:Similar to Sf3b6: Splicing factor 3B subunit 6 (Drosophila melanogaster), partial [Cotesia congregata]
MTMAMLQRRANVRLPPEVNRVLYIRNLPGFNVCNRYLVVLYYQSNKAFKRVDVDKKMEDLENKT